MMLRMVAVGTSVLATLLPGAVVAQAGRPADVHAAADSLLRWLHERGQFNGAVVLSKSGQELFAKGFGPANVDAGVKFTPDTPVDGASIAKTLTAAAVLVLEEEGRLRLSDPVQLHVPEYPHPDTRVLDLITHSAGLPEAEYGYFDELIPADKVKTTELFLEVLRTRGVLPDYQRGTRFRYSSLGFDVAALVVERVSGRKWEEWLRERIFAPLRMDSTFLRPAQLSDWRGSRTLGYRRDGDTLVANDVFDNEGFYGGSNLYFSARDLNRWSQSFYLQPILSWRVRSRGAEGAVLGVPGRSAPSAINLLSWYYLAATSRYHYPGSLQGFWSSVYRDDDREYSVVYVSNNSMPQWLRPLLTRSLIEIVEGRPVNLPEQRLYLDLSASSLEEVPGTFSVEGIGEVIIDRREGRGYLMLASGLEYQAIPVGDGQLYIPGLDVWIGFPAGSHQPFSKLTWLSVFHVGSGDRVK
jgi:CubicO group peptidase (beta-lactamase class C family)